MVIDETGIPGSGNGTSKGRVNSTTLVQNALIWCPLLTCKALFYKAEEMPLIVPYVKTTPVGRLQEVPQEVN